MILGALLDAGLDFEYLKSELQKLRLPGYELKRRKVKMLSLAATKFDVCLKDKDIRRGFSTLKDIERAINKSRLKKSVKELSCGIFKKLAEAECRAHGYRKDKAHFHEIGDTDSLIDIVGAVIALDYLGIERVCCSAVNVGSGMVCTAHGDLPVPAPVTSVLLKGMFSYSGGEGYELATPTGVAILKTLCGAAGDMPLMNVGRVGAGAGNFQTPGKPNILRVFLGEAGAPADYYNKDSALVVQANIDDMNLIGTEVILERILQAGALDVYFAPIYMKKTRMGILLSVITEKKFLDRVLKVIFEETTTFGVRTYEVTRYKLDRVTKAIKTKYGSVKFKTGRINNKAVAASPEYEDCKLISVRKNIPFRRVYEEVKRCA